MGTESNDLSPPVEYADLNAFHKATKHEAKGRHEDPGFSGLDKGESGRLPLDGYRLPKDSKLASAGRQVILPKSWFEGRKKYLTDTHSQEWGVPMEPAQANADGDYWKGPIMDTSPWPAGAGK